MYNGKVKKNDKLTTTDHADAKLIDTFVDSIKECSILMI